MDMRPTLGENQGLQCLSTMSYMPKNLGLPLTLICQVITPTRTLPVRAVIDPGSQITMIKKSIATELGLKGPKRTLMALWSWQYIYPRSIKIHTFHY